MNVKLILWVVAGVALVGFGFHYRGLHAEISQLKTDGQALTDLLEDAQEEVRQCEADKAITEDVSNDYQNSIANLRRQLDRLRRDTHCVPIQPSGPSGVPADTGGQLSGRNGLSSGWLYDFAGRAEQDRLTAKSCVSFMDKLYQSRGYNQ